MELETKIDKFVFFFSDGNNDALGGALEDMLGRSDSGVRKLDATHGTLQHPRAKSELLATKDDFVKQLEAKVKSIETKIESSHEQQHEQSSTVQRLNDIKANQDAKLQESALQVSSLHKKLRLAEDRGSAARRAETAAGQDRF